MGGGPAKEPQGKRLSRDAAHNQLVWRAAIRCIKPLRMERIESKSVRDYGGVGFGWV